jgi:hypothetical protein
MFRHIHGVWLLRLLCCLPPHVLVLTGDALMHFFAVVS